MTVSDVEKPAADALRALRLRYSTAQLVRLLLRMQEWEPSAVAKGYLQLPQSPAPRTLGAAVDEQVRRDQLGYKLKS